MNGLFISAIAGLSGVSLAIGLNWLDLFPFKFDPIMFGLFAFAGREIAALAQRR